MVDPWWLNDSCLVICFNQVAFEGQKRGYQVPGLSQFHDITSPPCCTRVSIWVPHYQRNKHIYVNDCNCIDLDWQWFLWIIKISSFNIIQAPWSKYYRIFEKLFLFLNFPGQSIFLWDSGCLQNNNIICIYIFIYKIINTYTYIRVNLSINHKPPFPSNPFSWGQECLHFLEGFGYNSTIGLGPGSHGPLSSMKQWRETAGYDGVQQSAAEGTKFTMHCWDPESQRWVPFFSRSLQPVPKYHCN